MNDMKKWSMIAAGLCIAACDGQHQKNRELAGLILGDTLMGRVEAMAREVVRGGFNAGDGYGEVWIRDLNTFVELAMEEVDDTLIRDNLLTFFRFQGEGGDMVDGFIDITCAVQRSDGYAYRYSDLEPRYAAHKNTVETDQESSLIQAVARYVAKSGDTSLLGEQVGGRTVLQRIEHALEWLFNERYDRKYNLLWGATTVDWGDVQPEHSWGVAIDENSHLCLDIYDNAFFMIAIDCFLGLTDDQATQQRWSQVRENIRSHVRRHLWDSGRRKFIPHLYLAGSPFPAEFDEDAIYYHGGTATAIEAGLLSEEEIACSYDAMKANVKAAGAQTIGLTVYPPYPAGYFKNPGMHPYGYQNGGDWGWFGGRMVSQLVRYGFAFEAYEALTPMLERVVANDGFYEWYSPEGVPSGSGSFRGEAGVLFKAISDLREWAMGQ